jgi:HlyD family secretion protein
MLVVAVAAALTTTGCGRHRDIQVTTAEVTAGDVTREIFATGTFQPARSIDVSTQVPGTIQSLGADFNTKVRAGQVVAQLDPARYQAQLEEARAKLVQAESDLAAREIAAADARAAAARADTLAGADLVSKSDAETARLGLQQASADLGAGRAAVLAAKTLVKQAQLELDRTTIRSPINGLVINRAATPGQTVAVTMQSPLLFTIADLRRMHLLTLVSEADLGAVRTGTRVVFDSEAAETRGEGVISQVRLQPVLDPPARPNPEGRGGGSPGPAATTGVGTAGTSPAAPPSAAPGSAQGDRIASSVSPPGPQGPSSTGASPSPVGSASAAPVAAVAPGSGAVSYTAVIDVDNPDGTLTPGSTALVAIPGQHRRNVVRIPSAALTFLPTRAMLDAIGQNPIDASRIDRSSESDGIRTAIVWQYRGRRFTPVTVRTGLADDRWTELVDGPLRPGDAVVTNASSR